MPADSAEDSGAPVASYSWHRLCWGVIATYTLPPIRPPDITTKELL